MYATPSELASYLQKDLDTATATLALTVCSGEFSRVADTWWSPQTTTYSTPGIGNRSVVLPFRPVVSVSAVRIDTVAVTDYKLVGRTVYRTAGFGAWYNSYNAWYTGLPPADVQIDLTYGFSAPTDDVKGAVLECAAAICGQPDGTVTAEGIDDYTVRYLQLGRKLTPGAQALAELIRGPLVA
jgi:hypothetical protein